MKSDSETPVEENRNDMMPCPSEGYWGPPVEQHPGMGRLNGECLVAGT